jgi:hypothetical protein
MNVCMHGCMYVCKYVRGGQDSSGPCTATYKNPGSMCNASDPDYQISITLQKFQHSFVIHGNTIQHNARARRARLR